MKFLKLYYIRSLKESISLKKYNEVAEFIYKTNIKLKFKSTACLTQCLYASVINWSIGISMKH